MGVPCLICASDVQENLKPPHTCQTNFSFKSENDPLKAPNIRPESNPEERVTELSKTLQDNSKDTVREDIAGQEIANASPSHRMVDAMISSEATRTSPSCSPMTASNRRYTEPSIYAIPSFPVVDEKLEGALHTCLTSTALDIPRPDWQVGCAVEAEEAVGTDYTDYRSDECKELLFSTEAGQSPRTLSYELDLQLSSPLPSSPPTSSPPPASSRPSSPVNAPDNTSSLTDLVVQTGSEDCSPGRGISEDSLSPLKSRVLMVVSDEKFELDKPVQKELKRVRMD